MRIFLALCFMFVTTYASADFLVYSDKTTDEIEFIVEEERKIKLSADDAIRLNKTKLPGSIKDYDLTESYTDYKLRGKQFIINTKKISDRVNVEVADTVRNDQKILEQDSAKTKLMALGLTESEFLSLIE